MCNKLKTITLIAGLLIFVHTTLAGGVTDEKLKDSLSAKYGQILKEAELDRQNDPDTYQKRLEFMDSCLRRARSVHGGMRVHIYMQPLTSMSPAEIRSSGYEYDSRPDLLGPESVPFLLEILIKGPPLHTNGMWKDHVLNASVLAWVSLNQMTGRSYFVPNKDPNVQDITEFRNWWQNNKNEVIEKFYNKKTGRLETKFEKTDLEKESAMPRRSPSKRAEDIRVDIRGRIPP